LRFNDAIELATTRLGPYAERHLGWGRQSILNRIGESGKMTEQLAAASRAARDAFRKTNKDVFAVATARAQELGELFSVQVRQAFAAELDIHGSAIASGGVSCRGAGAWREVGRRPGAQDRTDEGPASPRPARRRGLRMTEA